MADYVSNKELFGEMCIYRAAYTIAVQNATELPVMSDKIAWAIMRIANKLSNSYNFVNYSYKDEMISDGILKCIAKAKGFDPLRSENPFAYFSQIIWNSFINRIKEEQHETSIKARYIREKMAHEFVEHGSSIDSEEGSNAFVEFLKENDVLVDYYEKKKDAIHDSLKHRNKTSYGKKKDVIIEISTDLSQFEL
jgi:hypothetical protein